MLNGNYLNICLRYNNDNYCIFQRKDPFKKKIQDKQIDELFNDFNKKIVKEINDKNDELDKKIDDIISTKIATKKQEYEQKIKQLENELNILKIKVIRLQCQNTVIKNLNKNIVNQVVNKNNNNNNMNNNINMTDNINEVCFVLFVCFVYFVFFVLLSMKYVL